MHYIVGFRLNARLFIFSVCMIILLTKILFTNSQLINCE